MGVIGRVMKLSDPFRKDEIKWRVGQCGSGNKGYWAQLLAYVDARSVQDRLDQVVGPMNWQSAFEFLDDGVMCTLSIRCSSTGVWIRKQDGSPETKVEAFKGGISKALVRAGSAWGIGRYLYGLGITWAETSENYQQGWNRAQTKDRKTFYWKEPQLPKGFYLE